ncbi:MAG: iron(III) transport system ATP-binding protein [Myxococcota bacterium]
MSEAKTAEKGVSVALTGIQKSFGRTAVLHDVSLSIAPGERVALLGPSGCGKTTLLRIIAGLERPDAGQVQLGDVVAADSAAREWVPPERRGIGLVFQDYALFPHLNAAANVTFGLRHRVGAGFVAAALTRVGLAGLERRHPHELSGGQQQRLALARALAPEPGVLLLDEPFSSLDTQLRASVRDEVRALAEDTGTTTVLVTHDQTEALAFADRVAVMCAGRIRQFDTPERIYAEPADLEVARLVGEVNVIKGTSDGVTVETALGRLDGHGPIGNVRVMIRPEQLVVTGDGAAATVRRRVFSGPLTWLTFDLAGTATPIRASVSGRLGLDPGKPALIGVVGPVRWF